MSKSRARLLAELLNTSGRVKKDKSQLTGGDDTIDLDSLPTITNAKLENSSISIAGHSTALGGSVSLNTGDITEHTDYKYYTDARVRAAISVDGNLSYNSSTGVLSYTTPTTIASLSNHDTADLAEGTNLYYTKTRVDSDINNADLDNISEGSTNLYYTAARADSDARNGISVNDAGGLGSLSYASGTGVITYNGPQNSDIRGLFSGGTGVTYNSSTGSIAVGQPIGTADSVEHGGLTITGNVTIGGNLSVAGTQTITEYNDLRVSQPFIKVADSNQADNVDLGLVGRYSDDGGTTIRRAGFVRDASNGEWYVFSNLVQDGIDSSNPDQTLNLSDSTIEFPIWNFGGLRGQYLGFDSDFRVHSTDYSVYESDFTAVAAGRYGVNADNNNVNITLPANPTTGDWIRLIDVGNWSNANYSPTLIRNGSTIENDSCDFELDIGQNIIEVLFINNTWNIYASVGQRGPKGDRGDSGALDSSNFTSIATSVALSVALG